VGRKSLKSTPKKKNLGARWGENKVPKKNKNQGKKTRKGAGRNKVAKKKLRLGLKKGKQKKPT